MFRSKSDGSGGSVKILHSFKTRFTFYGKRSVFFEIKRGHSITCSIPYSISCDILIFCLFCTRSIAVCVLRYETVKNEIKIWNLPFLSIIILTIALLKNILVFFVIHYYALLDNYFLSTKRSRRLVWKEQSTFEFSSFTAVELFFNVSRCEQLFVYKMASPID